MGYPGQEQMEKDGQNLAIKCGARSKSLAGQHGFGTEGAQAVAMASKIENL